MGNTVVKYEGSTKAPNKTASETPKKPAVGGIVIPTDKFALLAPYIGLGVTFIIATVVTVIYVKHVKRREKQ